MQSLTEVTRPLAFASSWPACFAGASYTALLEPPTLPCCASYGTTFVLSYARLPPREPSSRRRGQAPHVDAH